MSCKVNGLNKIIAVLRALLIATAFALATYFLLAWLAPTAGTDEKPLAFLSDVEINRVWLARFCAMTAVAHVLLADLRAAPSQQLLLIEGQYWELMPLISHLPR
jgi:hypothetical protein